MNNDSVTKPASYRGLIMERKLSDFGRQRIQQFVEGEESEQSTSRTERVRYYISYSLAWVQAGAGIAAAVAFLLFLVALGSGQVRWDLLGSAGISILCYQVVVKAIEVCSEEWWFDRV